MIEKLVRDKMPDIVRARGEKYQTRIAESGKEYEVFLRAKFLEEVVEAFVADGTSRAEELADVIEVIHAGAALWGIDMNEVERIRKEKLETRGGFSGRVIWQNGVE